MPYVGMAMDRRAARNRQRDADIKAGTEKCPRTCSECEGTHHAVLGSERCKHCPAILPADRMI